MRRWAAILVGVTSVLVLTHCRTTGGAAGCGDVEALREAVFRYQFEHNASSKKQSAGVYFLSLGDRGDPTPEFIARFAGHDPTVKPASDATVGAGGLVADPETGAIGLIFRIDSEQWADGEVTVEGGYYEGEVSASGNVYTVVCDDNHWTISDDRMRWIS